MKEGACDEELCPCELSLGDPAATLGQRAVGKPEAAAALTILLLLTGAAVVLWATGRPQGGELWDIHYGVLPWKERLTIAGAVAAGAGAAIALVVGYRKQRDAEDGKFAAAFADAAAQLGDDAPAVRVAGAYALAALADRYNQHRQQCIDALCAHLRLPYDPDAAKRNVSTITRTERQNWSRRPFAGGRPRGAAHDHSHSP